MIKKYDYIKILDKRKELYDMPIVIWCASTAGFHAFKTLKLDGVNVIGFTDSFVEKSGELFCELPLYTFEELSSMKDIGVFVATRVPKYKRQIVDRLSALSDITIFAYDDIWGAGEYDMEAMERRISEDKDDIDFVAGHLLDDISKKTFANLLQYRTCNNPALLEEIYVTEHPQYFPGKEILRLTENEVFVDAGAYDGATSAEFIKKVNGQYSAIYMMEPDELMYVIAKEMARLKQFHNVHLVKAGAYSFTGNMSFNQNSGSGSSSIMEAGSDTIKVVSIDEMLDGKEATYIKMDIEGAELAALEGAHETISKYRPKLAISIYHKPDDLWKIPEYILKNWPDYRIFIRHYTDITTETIVYATL